jgi:AraC-like DNA-binding protein
MVEVFYAAVVTSGRFLLGEVTTDVELELDYPEPDYSASYQQVFGFPVHFNSQYCQMRFQSAGLALPLATANPAVATIFREQCNSLLNSLGRQAPLSSQVQHILLFRNGDFPAIGEVARQLFMSERTLRRRLTAQGKSFQRLLDEVRFQLSKEYLANTSLPVSEVARLVGFSDSTNFRRSFKRWSGTLPSTFR